MHRKAGQTVRFNNNRHRAANNNAADNDAPGNNDTSDPDASDSQEASHEEPVQILQITRRKCLVGHLIQQKKRHAAPGLGKRDVACLQEMWCNHARQAAKLYTPSMWRVLFAVRTAAKTVQSAVLSACRRMLPPRQRHLWPNSRAQIDNKIRKSLGSFHARILRQVHIDLSQHGVPEVATPISFSFMDPIYAWAFCAHRVSAFEKLHFAYIAHKHPSTGERLYGASVAHGDVMRRACRKVIY